MGQLIDRRADHDPYEHLNPGEAQGCQANQQGDHAADEASHGTIIPHFNGTSMRLPLLVAVMLALACPSSAHDPYMEWMRPDNGGSCCSGIDCDTVTVRVIAGQYLVMWRGVEYPAPVSTLLDVPSPDGRSHACVIAGVVRCLVLGVQG